MKTRKRFGQHFLEPAWVDKLVALIDASAEDRFLEIGAGRGALTLALARSGACVVAVEIDHDLAQALAATAPRNVYVVDADVLALDLVELLDGRTGSAGITEALGRSETPERPPWRVVGNLPYGITSPVLSTLVDLHRRTDDVSEATLLLQREVVDRLVAGPGSRDYGVLGILVQLHADVERLLTLPPGAFRPPPAVSSAVVRLRFRPPTVPVVDELRFEAMVRALFGQRRKTALNALRPFAARAGLPAGDALARAELDPRRRPETFSLRELARLAEVFDAAPLRPVL